MRLEKGSTPKEVFAMKKILLPVDGSKRSIRTVEMVKQLCDPADSDITVVKVVSCTSTPWMRSSTTRRRPSLS